MFEKLTRALEQSVIQGSVSEWMDGLAIREFVQPWYTPLPVTPETTGIALGGLGNSYIVNPRARTVGLNFLYGTPVLNDGNYVEMLDFYYSERATNDQRLTVVDGVERKEPIFFYPLLDQNGKPWLDEDASISSIEQTLGRMLHDDLLLYRNRERIKHWNLPLATSFDELMLQPPVDRNLSLLSQVYGEFLRVGEPWQRSLIAEQKAQKETEQKAQTERHRIACYSPDSMTYSALFPVVRFRYQEEDGDHCLIDRICFSPVAPRSDAAALPVTVMHFSITNPAAYAKTITLGWLGENINGYGLKKSRPGQQDAAHSLVKSPLCQENRQVYVPGLDRCLLLSGSERAGGVHGETAMGVSLSDIGRRHATVT